MTNYCIDSIHGNQLTAGLQEYNARKIAQATANRLAQSVFLYADTSSEDTDSEEIEPETDDYSAVAGEAVVSDCQPDSAVPARDVDVTLTYPGGEISCNVTLWLVQGSWGPHGSPLEGWLSSDAVKQINEMHRRCRDAALEAIRNAAAKACSTKGDK